MKKPEPTLSDLGETELLGLLTRGWQAGGAGHPGGLLTGPGDDCAVLSPGRGQRALLYKTDAIVEGVHFRADAPPALTGRKALARNLSDIAAMGGEPWAALVTLAAPAATPVARVRGIYRGLENLAKKHDVILAGGETVRAPRLMLSIALLGRMPKGVRPVLRGTAKLGHDIWVTGKLGGSQQANRHLKFEPRLAEGQWLAREKFASAMMDLSDGLGADLPKLAAASGLGFQIEEEALPGNRGCTLRQILGDGEDYELLFTVPASQAERLRAAWPFPKLPLTRIGRIAKKALAGSPGDEHRSGYDHFRGH